MRNPLTFTLLGAATVWTAALASEGGTTERVSVDSAGTELPGSSRFPSISADGRFVAFAYRGGFAQPFVVLLHDRETGETEEVGQGSFTRLSSDGRFIAFQSGSTDLVPGDTNNVQDIFVYDRQTGETQRVSVSSDGVQGSSVSEEPVISADGRFVAFSTFSPLVEDDTNSAPDVYVHDRATGQTERVSLDSEGQQGFASSNNPEISVDGRYVVFNSFSQLVAGVEFGFGHVYLRDRTTGQTELISTSSDALPANDDSVGGAISGDGRFVAFLSRASNLVPEIVNGQVDVFVRDREASMTTRVSVRSDGESANSSTEGFPAISADGRHVAFTSFASNLVDGDTNGVVDVFAHDRLTGVTERLSVDSAGVEANSASAGELPAISADGGAVAFASQASNLQAGDMNGNFDIFVRALDFTSHPDPEGAICTSLIASGGGSGAVEVGEVCVEVVALDLTVTYTTAGGWTLTRTHLHLADKVADVPQTRKKNPIPGQFAHFGIHGTGTTEFSYTVPLANLPQGDLVIAAHADVQINGEALRTEGAWGAGERFAARGDWATYLTYARLGV